MLELKNITKSYKIDSNKFNLILDDLNLKISSNGLYFIFGKSGCGKTTLLNILQGLSSVDSGKILYNGKEIQNFSNKEKNNYLKSEIGIIFQNFNLFSFLTVKENIFLSSRIKGVDDKVFINELIDKYNLRSLLDRKVNSLSGGEQQRVAIVRSIISKPKIILCDEPTGALDHKNSKIVMETLKELSKNSIVIVVTHNEKLIEEYADGSFELKSGKLFIRKESANNNFNVLPKKRIKYRGFAGFLARKFTKKDKKLNIICVISIIITFLIFLVSFAFYQGLNNYKIDILDNYLNSNIFTISRVYEQESNGSNLVLLKKEMPSDKEIIRYLDRNINYEIYQNLDYFFNSVNLIKVNNIESKECTFYPYFNQDRKIKFYVNNVFCDEFGNDVSEIIPSFKRIYNYYDKNNNSLIEEEFYYELNIKISGINEEFKYLNTPAVYYPYNYFLDILDSIKTNNINKQIGTNYSWLDVLKLSDSNNEINSYSKLIVVDDEDKASIYSLIDDYGVQKDYLKIESNKYTIVSSFISLSESLYLGIQIFLGISTLCSLFLIGFISFSSFISRRKEVAILRSLGASETSVEEVFIYEKLFVTFIGFLISLGIFFVIKSSINKFLFNIFSIESLLQVDIIFIALLLLFSLVATALFTYMPLKFSKKIDIASELKEEWDDWIQKFD